MKNKILRTIQKVFCAVMMVVVIIISTVFILTRREQEIPHLYRWWDEFQK